MRQHNVHAHQKLLQVHIKIGTVLFVLQRRDRRVHYGSVSILASQLAIHKLFELIHAQAVKKLQQALVALLQHRQLCADIFQATLQFLHLITGRVNCQCLGQVAGQPDVVHDVATLLAF